jgi:hypothetical protein
VQPGLISIVIWLAVVILWWSGWRKELSVGLPEWGVTLFLVLWPFSNARTYSLGALGELNLGLVLILLAAMLASLTLSKIRRWTSLAAGLLIGSISLFMSKLALVIPSLLAANPRWYLAGLIGFIAVMLLRSPLEQWLAITVGLALATFADSWLRTEPRGIALLGDSEWMAGWWLAVGCSRSLSYLMQRIGAVWSRLNLRKGGERT